MLITQEKSSGGDAKTATAGIVRSATEGSRTRRPSAES